MSTNKGEPKASGPSRATQIWSDEPLYRGGYVPTTVAPASPPGGPVQPAAPSAPVTLGPGQSTEKR